MAEVLCLRSLETLADGFEKSLSQLMREYSDCSEQRFGVNAKLLQYKVEAVNTNTTNTASLDRMNEEDDKHPEQHPRPRCLFPYRAVEEISQ